MTAVGTIEVNPYTLTIIFVGHGVIDTSTTIQRIVTLSTFYLIRPVITGQVVISQAADDVLDAPDVDNY